MTLHHTIIRTVTAGLQSTGVLKKGDKIVKVRGIGGGDVSDAFLCETEAAKEIFVKVCTPSHALNLQEIVAMFEAEAKGLKAMHDTHTIRVPTPYSYGALDDETGGYLAMEYIEFGSKYGGSKVQEKLGEQLADMHLADNGERRFGFEVNNTIGSTPQDNTWTDDWPSLWRRRLGYQLELATRGGKHAELGRLGNQVLDNLDAYFEGLTIRPSLLHGDLWSGNWSMDSDGNPVILDPATYYGHHEADLGITKLFGGFSSEFYSAYHAKIPKAPGFEKRLSMYAAYHAINHLNMFGSSYLSTSMSLLRGAL
ncbi:Fructosamine/Ketosamine-3-kinase [Syncephalastrum racemosum]|uniref:protein-ribulosamine 3-kinase n=1 Tax=Syncephalastrum racemosum TaxID=13706 RepID=A0A1X2HDE9_SYNRA|nr:Fructosamine/Ketosamine-3-kinase [Syncephalastrum racemosum]